MVIRKKAKKWHAARAARALIRLESGVPLPLPPNLPPLIVFI